MSSSIQIRTYSRKDSATFRKTAEAFGGLSNMAPGYSLHVNETIILTTEALYQACRFPHRPEIQRLIIGQRSPMTAKMKSKPYRNDSRPDWDRVRIKVMRWCLQLKLAQHWEKFSQLLLSTRDQPIVEDSRKDDFWGAKATDSKTLVGMNVLGRLLMGLREDIKQGAELRLVAPPVIPNFLLFGEPLKVLDFRPNKTASQAVTATPSTKSVGQLTLPFFTEAVVETSKDGEYNNDTRMHVERRAAMIEGLKPYAEYKASGLPWLDTVPKHWDMAPNRALMKEQRQVVGECASDFTLLSLTLRGVIARDMVNPKGKFPAQFNTYKVVRPDDFVFCLFDVDETPRGVGLSNQKGMITGAYDIFSPQQCINPRFLYHYYLFVDEGKLMKPLYTGLRKTIQRGVFASLKAPCPPPDEQAAIVRFLDHANRKIDSFIRTKRKLIGLLNEQKQAIIHRAVTRGLNPDVPRKPSGMPWFGDIPKHWEVRQLRRVCRKIKTGGTPKGADEKFFEAVGFNWHTPSDFRDAIELGEASRQLSEMGVKEVTVFPEDTILMIGIGATIGKVSISRKPCSCNQQINAILPNTKLVHLDFLAFYLRTLRSFVFACGKFTTMPIINQDETKRLPVVLPPIVEQAEIAKHIARAAKPFTETIARTKREISLMQEYRTRLTADIVTGKLDVREVAAQLPDLPTALDTLPGTDGDESLLAAIESDEEE